MANTINTKTPTIGVLVHIPKDIKIKLKVIKMTKGLKTLHKMFLQAIDRGLKLAPSHTFEYHRDKTVNGEPVQLPLEVNQQVEDLMKSTGLDKKSIVAQLIILGVTRSTQKTFS